MLKQEYQYLLAALQFFTRIPVPSPALYDSATRNHALKYFPLIGWLVGAACAAVYFLAAAYWPASVAVICCVIAGLLLTGALHEDGFADSCDGFGGGWDKAQVLAIMKDPRIGNYAALGLILILLLKIAVLIELAAESDEIVVIALLLGHSASRLLVLPIPWLLDYARAADDSKSHAMVEAGFSTRMLATSSLFVLLPLLYFRVPLFWYAFASAALVACLLGLYFRHRLGGYTGDCLGATQQVTEVTIYLTLLASWNSL